MTRPGALAVGALVAVVTVAPVAAGDVVSGAEWRRLPAPERAAYVAGIVDAWSGLALAQESLGSRDQAITVYADVVGCVRDRLMPPPQILALVEKYAEDNPGLRNKDMPDIVFAALSQTCRR